MQERWHGRKIGLCLPGGGAAGATQAGALWGVETLVSMGALPPVHCVSGASVGALNAALFAQGQSHKLHEIWTGLRPTDVYSRWKMLLLFSTSYYSAKPLERAIGRWVSPERLANSPIKLRVLATDADTGEGVIATERHPEIARMLLASAAIPILFPEVNVGGRFLIDGGISDNSPMRPLAEAGCDVILVLHCRPERVREPRTRSRTRLGRVAQTIEVLFRANQRADEREIEALNRAGRTPPIEIVHIYPREADLGLLEFGEEPARRGLSDGFLSAMRAIEAALKQAA